MERSWRTAVGSAAAWGAALRSAPGRGTEDPKTPPTNCKLFNSSKIHKSFKRNKITAHLGQENCGARWLWAGRCGQKADSRDAKRAPTLCTGRRSGSLPARRLTPPASQSCFHSPPHPHGTIPSPHRSPPAPASSLVPAPSALPPQPRPRPRATPRPPRGLPGLRHEAASPRSLPPPGGAAPLRSPPARPLPRSLAHSPTRRGAGRGRHLLSIAGGGGGRREPAGGAGSAVSAPSRTGRGRRLCRLPCVPRAQRPGLPAGRRPAAAAPWPPDTRRCGAGVSGAGEARAQAPSGRQWEPTAPHRLPALGARLAGPGGAEAAWVGRPAACGAVSAARGSEPRGRRSYLRRTFRPAAFLLCSASGPVRCPYGGHLLRGSPEAEELQDSLGG